MFQELKGDGSSSRVRDDQILALIGPPGRASVGPASAMIDGPGGGLARTLRWRPAPRTRRRSWPCSLAPGRLIAAGMVAWGFQISDSLRAGARTGPGSAMPSPRRLAAGSTCGPGGTPGNTRRSRGTGYRYNLDHKPRPYGTVAGFPLYRWRSGALETILGGRYVLAGLIDRQPRGARRGASCCSSGRPGGATVDRPWMAVSAAIAFPAGLFWSALYPQSLYFALSVGSLMLMLDGRVALSCLVGCRGDGDPPGGDRAAPGACWRSTHRAAGWRIGRESALALAVARLGLLAYMALPGPAGGATRCCSSGSRRCSGGGWSTRW